MSNFIELALAAHQKGSLSEASEFYRLQLDQNPKDIRATYGLGAILLVNADLTGLGLVWDSLQMPPHPDFDRALAADSALSTLLNQQYRVHALEFLKNLIQIGIQIPNLQNKLDYLQLPAYLNPTYYDKQLDGHLSRYSPIESNKYVYAIDIVGGCNLRCPTCPVANQPSMPKGLMSIELFRKILKKISVERANVPIDIWLFNWTEPLLHPKIELFIEAIKEFNFTSFVSTNLNSGDRLDSLIKSGPERLKISLSSFKQEIYGVTHERGDIAKVKKNLVKLAQLRDFYKSSTYIWVGHHLYKHTVEEAEEIKCFSNNLGFDYFASLATLTPIEEVMKLLEVSKHEAKENLSAPYKSLEPYFLMNPLEIQKKNSAIRSGNYDCELRFNMTAIQHEGHVNLCCGTTQPLAAAPIQFLEMAHSDIESYKYNNEFCKKCISNNLHLTISDK